LRLRAIEKDSSIPNDVKRSMFLYADSLLGLDLNRKIEVRSLSPEHVVLLNERAQTRKDKNWQESDRLRDVLADMGIAISDGPDGQSWSWI
jgi:cysteinyl-tRNA synthetase